LSTTKEHTTLECVDLGGSDVDDPKNWLKSSKRWPALRGFASFVNQCQDLEEWSPSARANLTVARLSPMDNVANLLQALPYLRRLSVETSMDAEEFAAFCVAVKAHGKVESLCMNIDSGMVRRGSR
jgi:hypothetical protein